jgi:hypothetical protein
MSFFSKGGLNSIGNFFSKGEGKILFQKGGDVLSAIAPAVGLVNPALGTGLGVAGKVSTDIGNLM